MVSVSFEYYTDEYFGDLIPESDFNKLIKRAIPYVSARTFGQADEVSDDDELADKVRDALCSVAEVLKSYVSDDGVVHGSIVSEDVGGSWKRSYASMGSDSSSKSLDDIISNKVTLILANTGLLYAGVDLC